MSNATHTPGPWTLDACESGWMLIAQGGQDITAEPLDTEEPNARLIAAAPELLAALEEAQAAIDVLADDAADAGYPVRAEEAADLAMRLRAAIAKAKGVSV